MKRKAGQSKVLLIYTGGTIGMMEDARTGELRPFDFRALSRQVPELERLDVSLHTTAFEKPLDSSDIQPDTWIRLAQTIKTNYQKYDGFVILHGSDTMSFTASALSFMLENLSKPVILTGSQLPIGIIRTDGKENLITAIEVAGARIAGRPAVSEVCIYFESTLYRGNRTFKYNSRHFDAFRSPNYPELAKAGVKISYNSERMLKPSRKPLQVHNALDDRIGVIRLFPGVSEAYVNAVLNCDGIRAVIIETFGAGNASTAGWFIEALAGAIAKGMIVVNITQCREGRVIQGMYETSSKLKKIGVVGGEDMTFEAAVTKLMFLLGSGKSPKAVKTLLLRNLRGELSE